MSGTGELLQCFGIERHPQREALSPLPTSPGGQLESRTTYSRHDRTFDDVKRVGALMEEQTIRTTLDGDVEEVVKRPEVLHGEFPLKNGNGMAQ
jgi:hypothetical protein